MASTLLLLQLIQVNSVYLSVPSPRLHCSSVMLEVRLAASKLSVEGTVLDGVPQWTAVDGVEFCRPVGLRGHLLVCRAAASCSLKQLVDTLRGTAKFIIASDKACSCCRRENRTIFRPEFAASVKPMGRNFCKCESIAAKFDQYE